MASIRFSLRSLFHVVAIVCVAAFCVGVVIQNGSVRFACVVVAIAGIPYWAFILAKSKGSSLSRTRKSVVFGLGWIWVSIYLAVVMLAFQNERHRAAFGERGWVSLAFALPATILIAFFMLRAYIWTCNDMNME